MPLPTCAWRACVCVEGGARISGKRMTISQTAFLRTRHGCRASLGLTATLAPPLRTVCLGEDPTGSLGMKTCLPEMAPRDVRLGTHNDNVPLTSATAMSSPCLQAVAHTRLLLWAARTTALECRAPERPHAVLLVTHVVPELEAVAARHGGALAHVHAQVRRHGPVNQRRHQKVLQGRGTRPVDEQHPARGKAHACTRGRAARLGCSPAAQLARGVYRAVVSASGGSTGRDKRLAAAAAPPQNCTPSNPPRSCLPVLLLFIPSVPFYDNTLPVVRPDVRRAARPHRLLAMASWMVG